MAPYETEGNGKVSRVKVTENVDKVDELARHDEVEDSEKQENSTKSLEQSSEKKDEL